MVIISLSSLELKFYLFLKKKKYAEEQKTPG